ncbi:aldo/keto reductase [Labilithrix luteola]|nr:aldo/keto reductase [Labilithrix luteola]
MSSDLTRRKFIGLAAAGLALAACKARKKEDVPKSPHPGAPVEGATQLPAAPTSAQQMPMRPLGSTGAMVSLVGLGGFHIGLPKEEDEGIRLIRTALDHGINFLDNCWDYNGGRSEERMGKALEGGYRDRAFLMTKLDGRTREAAQAQLEQSLKRLRTDRIDLVQIHEVIRMTDPARVFAPGGAIEALVQAKQAGKLRFIGFTGHKVPEIHLAMLKTADEHGFRFDAVQMPLNVMDAHYKSFEKKVLPVLLEKKMGVLGMKALGSGILLESHTVSAVECLHYAMNLPTSTVITGCETMGVLQQAIGAALSFQPLDKQRVATLLASTAAAASDGKYEKFKTTERFDGTARNPRWLEGPSI